MSRIQDALQRAEDQRSEQTVSGAAPQPSVMSSARLADEVRRLEASLASWRPRPEASVASARPAARWDEDMRRCEEELAAHEARISRSQEQRASLDAQVAAQDQVAARAVAMLQTLRQQLHEAEAAVRQAEADQAAQAERLLALRRCQALSQAAAEAERDFQAHATAIARISRVQQRVNERLSKHQLQAQQLQQAAAQLRRQLNDAVTQTTSQIIQGGGRHE